MRKNWKKVLSLLLAVAMVFTMNTSVFAAGDSDVPESIPAVGGDVNLTAMWTSGDVTAVTITSEQDDTTPVTKEADEGEKTAGQMVVANVGTGKAINVTVTPVTGKEVKAYKLESSGSLTNVDSNTFTITGGIADADSLTIYTGNADVVLGLAWTATDVTALAITSKDSDGGNVNYSAGTDALANGSDSVSVSPNVAIEVAVTPATGKEVKSYRLGSGSETPVAGDSFTIEAGIAGIDGLTITTGEKPEPDPDPKTSEFDWTDKGSTFGVFDTKFVKASDLTDLTNKVSVDAVTKTGYIGISVNEPAENGYVVIEGDDAVVAGKVCLSANDMSKVLGIILSGNAISYNYTDVYDDPAIDSILGGRTVKIRPDSIVFNAQTKGIETIADLGDTATYAADDHVYDYQTVEMSVSLDKWTISSDVATTGVYFNANKDNELAGATEPSSQTPLNTNGAVTKSDIYAGLTSGYAKAKNVGGTDLTVPSIASTVGGVKNDTFEPSENGAKFDVTDFVDDHSFFTVVNGTVADDLDAILPLVRANNYTWTELQSTGNTITGKVKKTDYTIVVKTTEGNRLTAYTAYSFTTLADAPKKSDYTYAPQWKAYSEAPDKEYVVSKNEAGALLINGVDAKVTSDSGKIILAVSNNKGVDLLKVNEIYVDEATEGLFKGIILTPSSDGIAVSVNNAAVFESVAGKGSVAVPNALVAEAGVVVVSGNGIKLLSSEETLKKDDMVAAPVILREGYEYSVSLNDVTLTLSGNNAPEEADIVWTDKQIDKDLFELKRDKAADIDELVGNSSINDIVLFGFAGNIAKFYKLEHALPAVVSTPITDAEVSSTSNKMLVTNQSGVKFAFSSASKNKAETKKGLTYNAYDVGTFEIVSFNNAKDGGDEAAALKPGETYYVYGMAPATASAFAKYGKSKTKVTMGASYNFVVKPEHDTVTPTGKINRDDVKTVITKVDVLSKNAVTLTDAESKKILDSAYDTDAFDYYISGNELPEAVKIVNGLTPPKRKVTYKIETAKNYKPSIDPGWDPHNDVSISFEDGSVYIMSSNSILEVEDITFYFNQGKKTLLKNVKAKTDNGAVVSGNSLEVKTSPVSNNSYYDAKEYKNKEEEKLSANETFAAHFSVKDADTISADKVITIKKRPVKLLAKQNYFSTRFDELEKPVDTAAANVDIDDVVDEDHPDYNASTYVKTVTAVFDAKKIEKDKIYTAPQGYTMTYKLSDWAFPLSSNYEFTTANQKGFGYYVLPKYNVTYTGKFNSVSDNNTRKEVAVASGKSVSVNSEAAWKIDDYKKDNRNVAIEKYDPTIELTLPTKIDMNKANTFVGWNDSKGKKVGAKVTISDDSLFRAVIKEATPGFTPAHTASENILSIEISDAVTYTGMKHVTNPKDMIDKYAGKGGAEAAIENLKTLATKNSADVMLNVYMGNELLLEGYDYTVKYKNNQNAYDIEANKSDSRFASKAPQVTITFKNQYASYPTMTKYFTIEPADIDDTDFVVGQVTDSAYYKADTKTTAIKTGLVNKITGAALVANANGKKDIVITVEGASGKMAAGTYNVKVEGKNNYKGTREDEIKVIAKSNYKAVTLPASKAADYKLDFTAEDTFDKVVEDSEFLQKAVKAGMDKKKVTGEVTEIDVTPVKGQDYMVPGTKKINYKLNVEGAGETVYVLKGTFQYTINKAKASDIYFEYDAIPTDGVPYVAGGATLGYKTLFKGQNGVETDLSRIVTVKYTGNKKSGANAKATPKAVKGSYVDGKFIAKEFKVGKGVLTEDNVKLAYVVNADFGQATDAKKLSAIKKRKSIVLKDERGNVLKDGKDYKIEEVKKAVLSGNTTSGNTAYTVTFKSTGKTSCHYKCGEDDKGFTVTAAGLEKFLGDYTIKLTSGTKLTASDLSSLETGEKEPDEILKGKLEVKNGKDVISDKLGTDFHAVITLNSTNGKAFIQIYGDEKAGTFGKSDVFGKKQIGVKVY